MEMKFLLLALFLFSLILVYPQSEPTNCSLENPNKLLREIAPSLVREPPKLQLQVKSGIYPRECNSYRIRFSKTGQLKDSVLIKSTQWNLDGTFAKIVEYDSFGELARIYTFTYEKTGSDSIITIRGGFYHNSRYYFNEQGLIYRYEISSDSSFTEIERYDLYMYDESGCSFEASINYVPSSGTGQIWKWQHDTTNYVIQIFANDQLASIIRLNPDSCLVEDIGILGGNPVRIQYHLDSSGNIFKRISDHESKDKIWSYTIYQVWDSEGKLTRKYGTDADQKAVDIYYLYDHNGLLIQESCPLTRTVTKHYYVY